MKAKICSEQYLQSLSSVSCNQSVILKWFLGSIAVFVDFLKLLPEVFNDERCSGYCNCKISLTNPCNERVCQHINSDFNFSFAVEEFLHFPRLTSISFKSYRYNYLLIRFRNSFYFLTNPSLVRAFVQARACVCDCVRA